MEYWVLYRWHPHSVEMDKLWYTTYAKAAKAIKWYQNTPVEEQIIFFGE